jgi:hypothetical protein
MRTSLRCLTIVVAGMAPHAAATAQTPGGAGPAAPRFLELPHANGSLALHTAQIASVWYRAATAGEPSKIRIISPAESSAK